MAFTKFTRAEDYKIVTKDERKLEKSPPPPVVDPKQQPSTNKHI